MPQLNEVYSTQFVKKPVPRWNFCEFEEKFKEVTLNWKLIIEIKSYLERRVRIKKGFLEITATKSEREGPRANKAYPIPAATVMALARNQQEEN